MLLKIQNPLSKSWIEQTVKAAVPELCKLVKTVQTVEIKFESPDFQSDRFSVNLTVLTVEGELATTSISHAELLKIIFGALKNPHQIHTLNFVPGPQGWNDFECYVTRHAVRSELVMIEFSGRNASRHCLNSF